MTVHVVTPEQKEAYHQLVFSFLEQGKDFSALVESDPQQAQEMIDELANSEGDE
jgi:hypothetical protein